MIRAALSGRVSSVVGLPTPADPSSPVIENEIRVVLPPVALPLGDGEHDTERALSRRSKDVATTVTRPVSPPRRKSVDVGGLSLPAKKAHQVAEDIEQVASDDLHLAELLGTMYHSTCQTIEVHMEEYAS